MKNKTNILFYPMFNYIGGKRWLRKPLQDNISFLLEHNTTIDTYCEPFMGGLGAFSATYPVLKKHNINNIILNDINQPIVEFYKLIQQQPDSLFNTYRHLEEEMASSVPEEAKNKNKTQDKQILKDLLIPSRDCFNEKREIFNKKISEQSHDAETAALLLFLQKHCFNGVYRENKKGYYNTPFNWEYKNIDFNDIKQQIESNHAILNKHNILFLNKSYSDLDYSPNILVYCDPPYINEKKGENQYNKQGFDIKEQKKLIDIISNSYFLYSNHDNDSIIKHFESANGSENINIERIGRKNIISSSKESRKNNKMEILVRKQK